jgi:hypothetical protein
MEDQQRRIAVALVAEELVLDPVGHLATEESVGFLLEVVLDLLLEEVEVLDHPEVVVVDQLEGVLAGHQLEVLGHQLEEVLGHQREVLGQEEWTMAAARQWAHSEDQIPVAVQEYSRIATWDQQKQSQREQQQIETQRQ